ncbi:hypothetical protein L0244_17525 [bacterium]|nr:hypothetical protein [bacterium]MCI0691230.1 hypothetical protein [candidate division KSB1 bacterium]
MRRTETGLDKPGIPTVGLKPHLGDLLLERYGERILGGFDDLKNFELIDRLEKPVLSFDLFGGKKLILDLQQYLASFPYAYIIQTRRGTELQELSNKGTHTVEVYISRFPKLIKFIRDHWKEIPNDFWGLLYGYPLAEVHQFTYDWEAWAQSRTNVQHE